MTIESQQQEHNTTTAMIIERLGGQDTLDLTIVGLADSIQTDPELRDFYSSFLLEDLIRHTQDLFKSVFSNNTNKKQVQNSILLRHYGLIQKGFNERHFDMVVQHFTRELEGSWVNTVAIGDAVSILNSTARPVFEKSSSSSSSSSSWSCAQSSISSTCSTSSALASRQSCSSVSSSCDTDDSRSNNRAKRSETSRQWHKKKTNGKIVETKARRGSSGEFLLNMIRGKQSKRTKQQEEEVHCLQ